MRHEAAAAMMDENDREVQPRREMTKHFARKNKVKEQKKAKKEKQERRKERKQSGVKLTPNTIESLREPDSTTIDEKTATEEILDEITKDLETDELSNCYVDGYEPKVLITFSEKPIKRSKAFAMQLCKIIPNCVRMPRRNTSIKNIVKDCIEKGFTDVVVINEDRFEPNGLLLIHLPDGPTAYFRLSNVQISNKRQEKEFTYHRPEVILNNFNTRLGQTVGKMLGALFHHEPEFKGRRVVTFHNQRDYIFFRQHRYKFIHGKPALRELGPRFTIRLQYLQRGTFDSKLGDYEWILSGKRHELETSRRRFFL